MKPMWWPGKGTQGRETENKAIVAVAVEKNGRGLGRIRLRRIGVLDNSLFLRPSAVEPGAMSIPTDGELCRAGNGRLPA